MGFFDWFRRKAKPLFPMGEGAGDAPRCHHYTLAHVALRQAALTQPLAFLGVLASPDATRFLSDMLRQITEHCQGRERGPDFSVDDITVHTVRVGAYPAVVIEMPRPRAVAEAYFVAAVVLADLEEDLPEDEQPEVRYFTLERGMTLDGPSRTVLCEWTESVHSNFGDGPPAEVTAFVAAIAALLNEPGN